MGAAASRHLPPYPDIFRWVQDAKIRVNSYVGWHGVGISMAAKAVAKAAKESNLFDHVLLVAAGDKCSPWKLQKRIAKQLGIIASGDDDSAEDEEEESKAIDIQVAEKIAETLMGHKLLIIIDRLMRGEGMDFLSMGIAAPWGRYNIFITTPYQQVASDMKSDFVRILSVRGFVIESPSRNVTKIQLDGVHHLLEHFRDEAGDVANTNSIGCSLVAVDGVFNCFLYLSLFQKQGTAIHGKELTKYYVGEGYIAAFEAAEGVLGEMVSRWMVERSSPDDDDGKFSLNSHLWRILEQKEGIDCLKQQHHIQLDGSALEHDAKWIALPKKQTLLLQQQHDYENLQLSTLLLNDNPQLTQIPDNFFHGIPNLKVLDLSRTAISSLPPSLSCLVHLRFLKLRECSSLNTLPPTLLNELKRLVILDLHGTPISAIPAEAFEQMPDLRLLDLSHTNIHSLPSSLLSSLCNLEQLFLRGCGSSTCLSSLEGLGSRSLQALDLSCSPKLESLPPSIMINLSSSLKKLILAECNALVEVMPCQLIRQFSALEELDISGCGGLRDVENVSFEGIPKLRALSLCNTKIARLSLNRCPMLEDIRLQGLSNLKSLHLSSIKIKEFPSEISEMKCLEQLRLTNVQHLKKVNWTKVHWLPEKLEWDECGCSIASALRAQERAENRDNDGGKASSAFISVSNAKIFLGLDPFSPFWENSLSEFRICISPCRKQHEKKEKEKRAVVDIKRRKPLVYAGIHSKINPNEEEVRDFGRHLEIEGVDGVLHGGGIKTVAAKAEGVLLRENGFLKCLSSDLGLDRYGVKVKECRVERCHKMEHLLPEEGMTGHISGLRGRLWVSDMGRLKSVYDGYRDFTALKRLHIECCQKLDTLFGRNTFLVKLETLHIRFCARLESVFQGKYQRPRGEKAFPELRSLHLWELPKLNDFRCDSLPPILQKLRVGACPKLQRLPLLPNSEEIKIEGESDWWSNLQWDNQGKINKEAINFQSRKRQ